MADRPPENDPRLDTKLWDLVERIPVPSLSERFLADLQENLQEVVSAEKVTVGSRLRRRALVAALVIAIAVGTLVGVFIVDRSGSPTIANARELAAFMGDAWNRASTLQATVAQHEYDGGTTPVTIDDRVAFAATAVGDYRIAESSSESPSPAQWTFKSAQVRIYNAETNTWLSRVVETPPMADKPHVNVPSYGRGGGKPQYTVLAHYWSGTGPCPLVVDLGAMIPFTGLVRAALAETDATVPVEKTSWQGHTAWRVRFSRIDSDGSRTSWDVVVDATSGFPLHASTRSYQGSKLLTSEQWDLTNLRVDQAIPADTFSTTHPGGFHLPSHLPAPPRQHFDGICRLDQLAGFAGYLPPLPSAVPIGYKLVQAAADPLSIAWYGHLRDRAGRPMIWFNQLWGYSVPADSLRPRTEAGLTYARGLDRMWIEMAPASGQGGISAALLREELGPDWGFNVIRRERLSGGMFAGAVATTWLDASGAGLLVSNRHLVVCIGGDLTRAEALSVAASLRRR